jgi:hypothetical protein
MKMFAMLAIAAAVFVLPVAAQESASEGISRPRQPATADDLRATLRAFMGRRGIGVSLDDYVNCVAKCKDLFPNEPALSTCIEGCRHVDSKLTISLD